MREITGKGKRARRLSVATAQVIEHPRQGVTYGELGMLSLSLRRGRGCADKSAPSSLAKKWCGWTSVE
jgi:hypothetical protein